MIAIHWKLLQICNFLSYRYYCKIKLQTILVGQQIYSPSLKCFQLNNVNLRALNFSNIVEKHVASVKKW